MPDRGIVNQGSQKRFAVGLFPIRLNKKRKDSDEIAIGCSLLPLNQFLGFVLVLIVLSTLSWTILPLHGVLSPMCAVFQFFLIPAVIGAAMRLKLKLRPGGITADSMLHKQSMYGRNIRWWNDLHSVRLRRLSSPAAILTRLKYSRESRLIRQSLPSRCLNYLGRGWSKQGFMLMDFRSGGSLALPLAGLSAEGLESLFIALSRWADPMTLNPDVIALQKNILTGQELNFDDSYTKMWEESLRDRFEVTNFVPLLGGQQLRGGELKILMLLACGGMSSIYLARNHAGDRCVIKEMSVPAEEDPAALRKVHEMFAREAAFLTRIDHPNIVKVLDHFVEGDRDYLVLEFIPGLTLRQLVQLSGPFPEHEVIEIGIQITEILSYLHGLEPPLVHRDLTPDNLIVREPQRTISLIDFGAAHEFVGKVTGTLIGKQCYIPPEQFQGHATPQSDIYALGATLYFLLIGTDPVAITQSHPQQANQKVSDAIDPIIARATALDQSSRFATAGEMLEALRAVRSRLPVPSNG